MSGEERQGLDARENDATITMHVTRCGECPFLIDDVDAVTSWLCFADEQNRVISAAGKYLPPRPPAWCPLREAARRVVLRVP